MTENITTEEEAREYNRQAEKLPNPLGHPCLHPRIVHKDDVVANDYNPNKVPDPELNTLERSILADGMTMPIVAYQRDDGRFEIVDGFHRFLVLTNRIGREWIPISIIDKDESERMSSTVRHNTTGDHKTMLMAELVARMEGEGMDTAEICEELGKEPEEIIRLKQVHGDSDIQIDGESKDLAESTAEELATDEYGQAWGVQDGEQE